MKLPAKIEYACKAIMELALRYDGRTLIQLNTIAKAQHIPRQFLVQLLIRLKSSGLVRSMRGIAGGYILSREPSRISLADVFASIDDGIIVKSKQIRVDSGPDKLFVRIWNDINTVIAKRLRETTFDSLILEIKGDNWSYYI